jgi:hypothetical protein
MAEPTAEPTNPLDVWRQFITDSERQWNGFFRDVLGTDAMSSAMSPWVEASLTVQRMVADNLERYYAAFNIPTHADLVSLAERMKGIEDSLVRLESAAASGASKRPAAPAASRKRPARTKRPAAARVTPNGVASRANPSEIAPPGIPPLRLAGWRMHLFKS